jgi:(5-formylfuran-3-yl)methyl phosphate synthase
MQLLVSVRDPEEASAALAGGADVIDAKEPARGALGAVTRDVLGAIAVRVAGARPISAALGDATDEAIVETDGRACAAAGVSFVKIGAAGIGGPAQLRLLLAAARRGTRGGSTRERCDVVAVAYADASRVGSLDPLSVLRAAVAAGAGGVLLDTADKRGPGLRHVMTAAAIAAWVAAARGEGLFVALAGQLRLEDLRFVQDAGADIAGVRGAACDGGRTGRIERTKVRALLESYAGIGARV